MATASFRPLTLGVLLILVCIIPSAPLARSQAGFTNLLSNGSFEAGTAPWAGLSSAQISTQQAHDGTRSARITAGEVAQGWIPVTPGQTYVLTAWFKWVTFAGSQWGYDYISVQDAAFQTIAAVNSPHQNYERNVWHKLALTLVAPSDQIRVAFGMFGPQDQVELYFDELALFARDSNQAPTASPSLSPAAGAAPLSVSFQAGAADADGAVQAYQWIFGDGSEARASNPTHIYRSRGTYTVTLNVWDQDGARASRTLSVSVSDALNPEVTITAPTGQVTYSTAGTAVTLGGQATTPSGSISSVTWDNLRTGAAGALSLTPSASLSWTTPAIDLAPGENEIQVSTIDTQGRAHADRIVVTRQVSGPRIYGVQAGAATVRQYEKYEVTFQVDTVSAYPLFRYDESPPPGVAPGAGVTVEGVITTPSGRTLRQPAFYRTDVTRGEAAGSQYYELTNQSGWTLRIAPTERGLYRVALSVRDASGTATAEVGSFTAIAPQRKGFIQVSAGDSRYFSFSNGEIFWPIGPAWAADYASGSGFNFDRPWMGGLGMYTTNWARWASTAQGLGNEGWASQLSYQEHYPRHELSQELFYPAGYRMWIAGFVDNQFHHRLKPSTNYQVQLRLKVVDLAGPRDSAYPFGLVVKLHGWPNEPGFEADYRAYPSLIPRISVDRDWHTVVATYRTADEGAMAGNDISIYLENVTAGRAFVDAFSMREILAGGGLGPELIRSPLADMHTYVEQRPAAAVDDQVAYGEREGIFFKYVVHDKNDWIQSRLLPSGVFADSGGGYYQPAGTKARWLLEQWWRYIVARWGYSTAVHSWELNNEGPPDDGSGAHAAMAQDFARFMRQSDIHPHLSTTSFWCCWRPTFWGDRQRFPDLGYADIHEYVTPADTFADGTPWVYDEARFQAESSQAYAGAGVGVPIIRGEVGFNDEPVYSQLSQPNPGVWFHNLLWAQLNAGAMFDPGYWYRDHFNVIDAAAIARPFATFVSTLDLQRGGFADVSAVVSNANLRVYGQKNVQRGKAYLWVQNRLHTWRNVMGVNDPTPVTPQSGTLTLTLSPLARYYVEWWDTSDGTVSRRELTAADEAGRLTLTISSLASDLALKVTPETPDPDPAPSLQPLYLPALER